VTKRLRFIRKTTLEELLVRKPKTKAWRVRNIETKIDLGIVKWFGRWRQYAFFPDEELVFEKTCLRTIADFAERQTRTHYKRLKGIHNGKH
jgi:hypothetical protein